MSSTLTTKTTTQTNSSTNFENSITTSTPMTSTASTRTSPCCACPETKKNRDQCIFETGDEVKCKDLIEAHKACMRSLGFNV